jgi:hypothetical protein
MNLKGATLNTPQKIERCKACGAPDGACVCDVLKPISPKLKIMILRHPQEARSKLGTAELLAKAIPGLVLKTGFSWRNISHAYGSETKPSEWIALFLGSKKLHPKIAELGERLVMVDKKGTPFENQNELRSIKGVILLDGNWSQSKTMWWRNAWLTRCKRGILNPSRKSLYKSVRREPRKESLSTLEALAESLAALEGNQRSSDSLLELFSAFIERVKKSPAKSATAPAESTQPRSTDEANSN